jgi:hypothetical protein
MATIRKITRRAPLSTFQNTASENGSSTFLALAGAAQEAYKMLEPVAIQKMQVQADQDWSQTARRTVGDPAGVTASSKGGGFRAALRQSESGGNYQVVNSEGFGGAYQWGQPRLDDYNRATGQNITMQQFLADPSLQERAQDWHEGDILGSLGGYVGQTVNGQVLDEGAIIGMAHLGGTEGARRYIESGGAYNPSDSNGTSLSDYAQRFGGQSVSVSSKGEPEVMIRTKDGSLQPRLYSPASGPILQAYNAAAGIAFQSEKILEASTALMDLSNRFEFDPDGFQQAAQSYIDQMVKDAPDMFRSDLRITMERQVQQRFLGILEDKQSDIRQRASNSNGALVSRYADEYADALAGGNPDAIAAADAQLNAVLVARESIPGLAWTSEQSFNEKLGAQRKAETIREKRQEDFRKDVDKRLRFMADVNAEGLTSADEGMLDDPNIAAIATPEVFADATAANALKNWLPSFTSATPGGRAAIIADLEDNPIGDERQLRVLDAAKKSNEKVKAAFAEDPFAAAKKYLEKKPPVIPGPEDMQGMIDGLEASAIYGKELKAAGHTPYDTVMSKDDAERFGLAFGKDVPPDVKAAMAGAIVQGLGTDAAAFFKQIGTNSKVIPLAGQMWANTGNAGVATEAIRGEAILEAGQVQIPKDFSNIQAVSTDIAAAIGAIPGADANALSDLAKAIYASRAASTIPEGDEAKALMESAWQAALGQTVDSVSSKVMGGVQKVAGSQTLLPPKVAAADLQGAIDVSFMADPDAGFGAVVWDSITSSGENLRSSTMVPNPVIWGKAGVGSSQFSVPMMGGKPLNASHFRDGDVRLVPVQGNTYRIEYVGGQGGAVDVRDKNGMVYMFDLQGLIDASAP